MTCNAIIRTIKNDPKKNGSRNGGPDMNTVFFRKWIVQSLLRQVIHIPQESPENIKLNNCVNSVTKKTKGNWPAIQRQRKWCFFCPRLVEDWLVESRLAKVSIYLLVCVAMCCQTAQENAALKQYFFYKINQHALVLKKTIWGVTHMIPHVRDWKLTEQSQVTSLENEKNTDKDRCSWGPGLIIF